ncbi:VanZ family protein [Agrococcus carbonis]|uniref:VanZ like family protein n=1 Tax=Agrococcus carbonis TaxID=684552 RepID=A0A1H1LBN8_9MICO|nr:VanZ family protein [Agrococcus carbonis]SDR71837.1 VanZ like family protein [Agrococcus carbonis]
MESSVRKSPRRWVVLALAGYALAVVIVLLLPVGYGRIVEAIGDALRSLLGGAAFGDGWVEASANVLLFVPLGGLVTLLLRRRWQGIALALALSAAAELAQIVIPARQPSLRDLAANVLGAAIGAGLAWCLVVRRERSAAAEPPSAHPLDRARERIPRRDEPRPAGEDAAH